MLKFGKKFRALRDKKKILTLVLSEKTFSERNNTLPPLQFKWSVPNGSSRSTSCALNLDIYVFQYYHWVRPVSAGFTIVLRILPPLKLVAMI